MITRKHYLYLLLGLVLIISFPIILNIILQISFLNITLVGGQISWLGFWSNYSGALISGLITLFVLYKTLQQNQINHIKQIEFQMETIKHQVKKDWFNNLKASVISNLSLLNFDQYDKLLSLFSAQSSNLHLIKEINSIEERIKISQIEIELLYNNNFISTEQVLYKKEMDNIVKQHLSTLSSIKDYFFEWEKNIERFSYYKEIKGDILPQDRLKIELLKQEGVEIVNKKIKELKSLVDRFRNETIRSNEIFKKLSLDLIRFEGEQLYNGLKDKIY